MYSKYSLFYESHKNQGYYEHAQAESTRPLFGREWPGDEANVYSASHTTKVPYLDAV